MTATSSGTLETSSGAATGTNTSKTCLAFDLALSCLLHVDVGLFLTLIF